MSFEEIREVHNIKIIRKLADGGMGSVYEAQQMGADGFSKTMAIKTILPELTADSEFVDLFIGEAKLVADLVHQNIVQIYHLGKFEDIYYIAMEFIYGINIEQFLERHTLRGLSVPVELTTFIVSRVCRGLEYAHKRKGRDGTSLNVVHRDVSPKNIMITTEGEVKLTDFGIAKARNLMNCREGEVLMGKARYMSPEQSEFLETDNRSDLFSLGIVMWELISGKALFEGEDTDVTLRNVGHMEYPSIHDLNTNVAPEVERILSKALTRDRSKRYHDAGEMGYDLEYFMYHDRYGPTILTLSNYLRSLFPEVKDVSSNGVTRIIQGLSRDEGGG